jgi:hypothetical protein
VFLRGNTKLVEERMVPDLLHVVPIGDNPVFNGVSQGQNTALGLSLIASIWSGRRSNKGRD